MSGIYMILNKVNGKAYIGQAKSFKRRFYSHKYALNRNSHSNDHLQSAWNKYGESNFDFLILEETDSLDESERFWISFFGTDDRTKGYNIEKGGRNGYTISEESRKKISEKNSGKNNPFHGKTHSLESRKKMRESRKGEKNHFHSSNISEEVRKKFSERFTGENNPQWGTSIIDEYGGMWFIKTIASSGITLKTLCSYLGVNRATISRYLKRRGYTWTEIVKEVSQ